MKEFFGKINLYKKYIEKKEQRKKGIHQNIRSVKIVNVKTEPICPNSQ